MKADDYCAQISVNASPEKVFDCINDVAAWWTENIEGPSRQAGDRFTVRFGPNFVCFRIIESVPSRKVVWLVTDCYLGWLQDKTEWTNTMVSFEIVQHADSTDMHFIHKGLTPAVECFAGCVKGWDQYIKESLLNLLTKGVGNPQKKITAEIESA